jgi:hypothetical protein
MAVVSVVNGNTLTFANALPPNRSVVPGEPVLVIPEFLSVRPEPALTGTWNFHRGYTASNDNVVLANESAINRALGVDVGAVAVGGNDAFPSGLVVIGTANASRDQLTLGGSLNSSFSGAVNFVPGLEMLAASGEVNSGTITVGTLLPERMVAGMHVYGPGIPAGAKVKRLVDNYRFEIGSGDATFGGSVAATGSVDATFAGAVLPIPSANSELIKTIPVSVGQGTVSIVCSNPAFVAAGNEIRCVSTSGLVPGMLLSSPNGAVTMPYNQNGLLQVRQVISGTAFTVNQAGGVAQGNPGLAAGNTLVAAYHSFPKENATIGVVSAGTMLITNIQSGGTWGAQSFGLTAGMVVYGPLFGPHGAEIVSVIPPTSTVPGTISVSTLMANTWSFGVSQAQLGALVGAGTSFHAVPSLSGTSFAVGNGSLFTGTSGASLNQITLDGAANHPWRVGMRMLSRTSGLIAAAPFPTATGAITGTARITVGTVAGFESQPAVYLNSVGALPSNALASVVSSADPTVYFHTAVTTGTTAGLLANAGTIILSSVVGIVPGMDVRGTNIQPNAKVTLIQANTVTVSPAVSGFLPAAAQLSFGAPVGGASATGGSMLVSARSTTTSGNVAVGASTIPLSSVTGISVGMRVAGPGIPRDATVGVIGANSITLASGMVTAGTAMPAATAIVFGTLQPLGTALLSSTQTISPIPVGGIISATVPMSDVEVTGVTGSVITLSSNLPVAVVASTFKVAGYVPRILSGLTLDSTGGTLTFSGSSGLSAGMVLGGGTSASGIQEIPSGTFVRSVSADGTQIVLNGSLDASIFTGTLSFVCGGRNGGGPREFEKPVCPRQQSLQPGIAGGWKNQVVDFQLPEHDDGGGVGSFGCALGCGFELVKVDGERSFPSVV